MVKTLTIYCRSTPAGEYVRPNGDKNAQRSTLNAQRSSAPHFRVQRSEFSVQRFLSTPHSSFLTPRFSSSRPRSAFTVIELMIVMGVLSILLSILLPVFHTVRKATLKARAKIEATALAQAVVEYKNVYGYWPGMVKENSNGKLSENSDAIKTTTLNWPFVSNFSNTWFKVSVTTSDETKEVNYINETTTPENGNLLYQSLASFNKSKDNNLNPLNPRRIHFVALSDETDSAHVSLPDPWGNEYIVVMGLSPSTPFTQTFTLKNTAIQTLSVSNLTAFAISLGPDGQNSTNLIFSAGVPQ